MKTLIIVLAVAALGACAHREPKPPRVETAPIGQSFDRINDKADRLDALANQLEENGQ